MSGLQEVCMFLQSYTLNLLNNRHKCQSLCQREFHPQPTLQQASPRKFSSPLLPLYTVLWGFDRAAQWQDTGSHPFSPHFQIKKLYCSYKEIMKSLATKTQRHKERIRLKTEERQEKKPSALSLQPFLTLCVLVSLWQVFVLYLFFCPFNIIEASSHEIIFEAAILVTLKKDRILSDISFHFFMVVEDT